MVVGGTRGLGHGKGKEGGGVGDIRKDTVGGPPQNM